jgi:hypothetical protein
MRAAGLALLLVALAAPHAVAAPAGHGRCPTIEDPTGDVSHGPVGQHDKALDMTAVDIAVTPGQISATLTVVGKPDPASIGAGRQYEIYFVVPEEGTFVLRAAVGNAQERYALFSNVTHAGTPGPLGWLTASAQSWNYVRDLSGWVEPNRVTIVAQRPRDLPLDNGAEVFARTWLTAADAPGVELGGVRALGNGGLAATVDHTARVRMRFGVKEACVPRPGSDFSP